MAQTREDVSGDSRQKLLGREVRLLSFRITLQSRSKQMPMPLIYGESPGKRRPRPQPSSHSD